MNSSIKNLIVATVVVTFGLGANLVYAVWTDPTAAPTGGSVALPLNISNVLQHKAGPLRADQFWSNQYCDAAGGNCFNHTNVAAAGGTPVLECFTHGNGLSGFDAASRPTTAGGIAYRGTHYSFEVPAADAWVLRCYGGYQVMGCASSDSSGGNDNDNSVTTNYCRQEADFGENPAATANCCRVRVI